MFHCKPAALSSTIDAVRATKLLFLIKPSSVYSVSKLYIFVISSLKPVTVRIAVQSVLCLASSAVMAGEHVERHDGCLLHSVVVACCTVLLLPVAQCCCLFHSVVVACCTVLLPVAQCCCCLLHSVVACCTVLLPVAQCCCLLHSVVACCTVLLPVVQCCCLLYSVVACCTVLLLVALCCSAFACCQGVRCTGLDTNRAPPVTSQKYCSHSELATYCRS
jgi:hypothetical protein